VVTGGNRENSRLAAARQGGVRSGRPGGAGPLPGMVAFIADYMSEGGERRRGRCSTWLT